LQIVTQKLCFIYTTRTAAAVLPPGTFLANWVGVTNKVRNRKMKTMKNMKILCLAFVLGVSAVAGLSGCAGDRYHESTGEYVDDSSLTARVKDALGQDAYKYPDVKVTTFKGTVQLSGFVDVRDQKERAGTIAKGVQGVKDVDNNITVKG
jgi:osmotically-inducible protein OsmY